METCRAGFLNSPLGDFPAVVSAKGLCRLCFPSEDLAMFDDWHRRWFGAPPNWQEDRLLERAQDALNLYFQGDRFDLPLDLRGSRFQLAVWNALLEIPSGQTTTYGAIADKLGRDLGARAVGHAVGSNPVPVFVPCHRVLGSDGRLTGFGGGLPMKLKLLQIEGVVAPGSLPEKPSPSWIVRRPGLADAVRFRQKSLFD